MAASDSGRRSFLRRATDALRDFFFLPKNYYEGAQTDYTARSLLPGVLQDARFDADKATREELARKARFFEANEGIVNRLADVFEQYTVGPGLSVVPKTEDEDYNLAAGQWWEDWCKFPDVSSNLHFGTVQGQMARALFIDGEVFIYKTFSRETGRPRIQLIEAHRISTPPHLQAQEGKGIIDGIEFAVDEHGNPVGKPRVYWCRMDGSRGTMLSGNTSGRGVWEPIQGDRIIHLFDPARPGMVRGLTYLYPVINDLHDLSDLQKLEMAAAKNNSEVANVVTNKTGEANLAAMKRDRWRITSQNASGNSVTKTAPLVYETTLGGRTIYISNGEKFEQFRSDRPGAATRDYWDYLVRKICAGVGISALLVLPFSLQGTVTRADLDVAAAFFKSKSGLIQAVLREIYIWAMGWAVKFDRSLDGAPREWWRTAIRPPRSVNVDVGRNSAAILDELEGGVRTYQDVCGELGFDWRVVLEQKAIEASFINHLVDKYGVTRDQIAQLAKQSMTVVETSQQTAQKEKTLNPPADGEGPTEPPQNCHHIYPPREPADPFQQSKQTDKATI
jgi:capsid protein